MAKNAIAKSWTLTNGADGRKYSEAADAPLSGGNAALAWQSPLRNGDTITITTDGTYNFGATGPTLLYYDDFSGVSDGQASSTTPIAGSGTVTANGNGMPIVDDVTGMPMGKGLRIAADGADQNNTDYKGFEIATSRHHEFFEFYVSQYPAASQTNSIPYLDGTATWQCKRIWHFEHFSDVGKSDVFMNAPIWDNGGLGWADNGRVISSNSGPTSSFHSGDTGLDAGSAYLNERIFNEFWVKCSPIGTQPTGSDGMTRMRGDATGVVCNYDFAGIGEWDDSAGATGGFLYVTVPGFCSGFLSQYDCQMYFGQIYQTVGAGSAARVVVTEASTLAASKKMSVFTIDSWSASSITAKVRHGVFYADGIDGLYYHVIDANNDLIASGSF